MKTYDCSFDYKWNDGTVKTHDFQVKALNDEEAKEKSKKYQIKFMGHLLDHKRDMEEDLATNIVVTDDIANHNPTITKYIGEDKNRLTIKDLKEFLDKYPEETKVRMCMDWTKLDDTEEGCPEDKNIQYDDDLGGLAYDGKDVILLNKHFK